MVDWRPNDGSGERLVVIASDYVGVVVARNISADIRFFGTHEGVVKRVGDHVRSVAVIDDIESFHPPEEFDAAVIATADDSINLLTARRLQMSTDAHLVVRLNDPGYQDVFADIGVETVCTSETVGSSLTNQLATVTHDG